MPAAPAADARAAPAVAPAPAVRRSSTLSGISAMPVPIASSMNPNQIQSTSGLTTTFSVAVALGQVVAAQHDVEVLGRRAADRDLGGRLALVVVEEPLRRAAGRSITLPSDQRRQLAGDHLLLAILLVREPVEAHRVACRSWPLCPGAELDVLSFW